MTLTCTCGGPCEELSIGSPIDAAPTFRCGTCSKRYRVVDCQLADLLKREREAADAVTFLRSEIAELDRMLLGADPGHVIDVATLRARREQVAKELHFRTIAPSADASTGIDHLELILDATPTAGEGNLVLIFTPDGTAALVTDSDRNGYLRAPTADSESLNGSMRGYLAKNVAVTNRGNAVSIKLAHTVEWAEAHVIQAGRIIGTVSEHAPAGHRRAQETVTLPPSAVAGSTPPDGTLPPQLPPTPQGSHP